MKSDITFRSETKEEKQVTAIALEQAVIELFESGSGNYISFGPSKYMNGEIVWPPIIDIVNEKSKRLLHVEFEEEQNDQFLTGHIVFLDDETDFHPDCRVTEELKISLSYNSKVLPVFSKWVLSWMVDSIPSSQIKTQIEQEALA